MTTDPAARLARAAEQSLAALRVRLGALAEQFAAIEDLPVEQQSAAYAALAAKTDPPAPGGAPC